MKLKQFFAKNARICFLSFLIVSIISCEIGLGSAVDTQPPSITIDGPGMNAIIRDSFAISGSWNDDGAIEDIYVILKRTKRTDNTAIDSDEEIKINGEWSSSEENKYKGSWRAIVDPFKEEQKLIDGAYEATVYIEDKSHHTTSQSTSFTIDNTPPIIVITRPSTSIKAKNFDTYGQLFTLEGQAADDNNVSLIEVRVYNDEECTDFNHAISLKNVPNSINLDAAIYDKELGGYISQDEDKYNFEVPLEQASEGKEFYCKIVGYDGAQKYPIEEADKKDDDERGNCSEYYYLYKDIATVVLQNYKITEVYSILNGSYSSENSRSAITPDEVISLISSDDLKTSVGKFILNPTNNPTFQITGRSPLALDGEDFKDSKNDVTNGGQIVIEVSPGLDGILLDEESLKVYAQKCDKDGKVATGTPKIYPSNPTVQESGTSYRFTVTIKRADGFEIGENYIVGVDGHDQSTTKNPVEPASGKAYGFHLASSGNAPSLDVTSPASGADVYKRAGQSQTFSGTIQVEAGVPILNIYKAGLDDPIITKTFTEADGVNKQTKTEYSFSEVYSDFGTTSGKQVYRFVASLEGIPSPTVEREIIFDVNAPEITISQPQVANKYDENGNLDSSAKYVNGTIAFEVSAKDKGGSGLGNASKPTELAAKYEVLVDGAAVLSGELNLDNEVAVAVDTTDAKINGKTFIFRVSAQDNAGNVGQSDDQKYTYVADQSTDIPFFVKHVLTDDEISNGKKDLDFTMTQISVYNSLDKTNKLGTVTKGDYLKFRCYDDDGSVKITIKNKRLSSNSQSDWENDVGKLTVVYNKSKDTKNLIEFDDYQFPNSDDECGFYEYVIILSDGNKTITTGPFLVNVAKNSASIKVEVSPEYAKDGNAFSNKITITPSMPPYSAYRKINGISENLQIGTSNEDGVYEFSELEVTDSVAVESLPADETSVSYYVVDGNNQASSDFTVTLKKDNDVPGTLNITAPTSNKLGKSAISDDEYAFRGEVRDAKSGVKYIYYYFGSESTAPTELSAYTREEASNGNYIINKTIDTGTVASETGNLYEGNWYLYIMAEDVAGNRTAVVSRQFDIDKSAPELSESGDDDLGYKNGNVTLSGRVFDSNGLKTGSEIVITDDKDTSLSPTVTLGTTDNTWSAEIEGLSDGKHTLTITATDKVGKTTSLKRLVTIDSKAPVVSSTMTLPNGYSFAATSVTISGTTTDEAPSSGLASVKYLFADGLGDDANKTEEFTLTNAAYWSATIPVSALFGSDMNGVFGSEDSKVQGKKYIWVKACDNAGNESEVVKKEFVYDVEDPVLSDVKIKYTESGESDPATALGTETQYKNTAGYTISGSFNDSGSNVTVGATVNGYAISPVDFTADSKTGTWSFTSSPSEDGTYNYIITATDDSGRSVTKNATIVVDKTLPSLVISSPADDYTTNSSAYTFAGTITETNLESLYASLLKNGTEVEGKTERLYPVNGDWSWTVTNLTNAASTDFTEYTIKLTATDKAGNKNVETISKKIIVDTKKPEITVSADKVLYNLSGTAVTAGTALSPAGTYFAKDGFTLSGTITEANFDAATIKNGESSLSFTSGGYAAGAWTYDQEKTDGEYVYNLDVSDKAGNSESIHLTVKIDTTAPETNDISAPVEGLTGQSAISETTYIFKGLAADATDGTGVSKIWYVFTNSETAPGTEENPLEGYTGLAVNDNASWSIPKTINSGTSANASGNLYEGSWYLYVKAQDMAGNISETATSRQFDIDFAKPVVTATLTKAVYNSSELTDGAGSFEVSGTASDSQALASVKVFVQKGTDTAKELAITVTNGKVGTDGNGTWTQKFIFGSGATSTADNYLSEGKYDIWAEAIDAAGKTTTTEKKQITIDYTAPVITDTSLKLNDLDYDVNKWYDSKTLKVDLKVTDNTSGVSTVQCITKKNDTENRIAPLSNDSGDKYTGTAQLASDGDSLTITFKAKDIAGNESGEITKTVKIDTTVPALELYKYKVGSGSLKSASGNVYINGSATLTVYGNYSDEQSGVQPLVFAGTKNGAQPTITYSTAVASDTNNTYTISAISEENKASIKSWKAEFTNESLETATLSVTGVNNAGADGLSVEKNLFAISRDALAPTLKNLNFTTDSDHFTVYAKKNGSGTVENYYINNTEGKFIISGLAEDPVNDENPAASGVESVKLEIEDSATSPKTYSQTSNTVYFANIDLSAFTSPATAKITINDYAGNSYVYTLAGIIFDTEGPQSVHKVDSTGKDLVFRIGDKTNDDISSTNASTYSLSWNTYTDTSVEPHVKYDKIDETSGGKYSGGSFGNSSTIKIRGSFEDAGSGLKQVFYKIYDRSNSLIFDNGEERYNLNETEKTQLVEDVISANQYFAPLATPENKRVFYNVKKDDYYNATTTDQQKLDFGGTQLKANGTPVVETKSGVEYYKFWKIIETTYSFTIPQLNEGCNYIVIVAEDNVGNYYIDTSSPIDHDNDPTTDPRVYVNYSMNLDTTPPVIELKTPADTAIKYAKDSYIVKVKVTDPEVSEIANSSSGIKSVSLSGNGQTVSCTRSATETDIWQADVSDLLKNNDSVTISATAKDVAGTTADKVVANIFKDNTSPSVSITAPSDADKDTDDIQINGTITLSGTANDNTGGSGLKEEANSSKTLKLYYTTNSELGAKTAATISEDDIKSKDTQTAANKFVLIKEIENSPNWKFTDIVTSKLDGITAIDDNTTVYFMVSTEDKSGNKGYSAPQKVIVNQHSDRPLITLSQITKNSIKTLKTKNVYGSITDDDGSLEKLWYYSGAKANLPAVPTYNSSNSSWTVPSGWNEITIDGNSWSIESGEGDGETTWYFAVADANYTVFAAVGDDTLKQPYLKYSDKENKVDGDSNGVTFKYDTNPPTPTYLYLYRAPKNTTTALTTIAADTNIAWTTENNIAFGASYNVLYAKVIVEEGTEMKALSGSNGSLPTSSPISISYKDKDENSPLTFNKILQVAGTGNNKGKYTYYLGPLVMNTSEACEFKITTEDAVGNKGYISRNIIVDNTAPDTITNVKPTKQEAVTGVVNFRGSVSDNENGSGILYETNENNEITAYGVEWYIPTYGQVSAGPTAITSGWAYPTSKGTASWEIEFENLGTIIGYNASSYEVSANYKDFETGSNTGLYDIPVWFRLTDAVGNVGYITNNSIRYNPNADRPVVQITYPVHEDGKDYVTMGGTINISGMANDDDGITAVYLQFDMDGDNTYENGVGISGTPFTNSEIVDIPNTNPVQKGVLANGTKSWYKTLSINNISNPIIKVRAISVEKDSEKNAADLLVSAWSDVLNIQVNNDVPTFSNIKLKKFDTAPTSANLSTETPSGEMEYASDMFIKGSDTSWYLTGEINVANTTTIASVVVRGAVSYDYTNDENGTNDTLISYLTNGNKKCYFAIPVTLANNAGSTWETTITATDKTTGQPQSNRFQAVINLDKTAPNFTDVKTVGENEEIKLYKNAYGASGVELSTASSDNYVQNSNGSFTLTGKINEEGSGFERLAFYFERKGSGADTANRIYNPMEEHGSNNQANRTNLVSSQANGSVSINSDGLPALYLTGVTRSNNLSIKAASLKNNKNIRKGGLVKIGDVYRLIDNIDNRDVDGTITFTPGCDTSFTTAEFIYAMVVDNNGESTNSNGTLKNDDGDGMVESFTKSGTNYIWDANIDSKYIPDGPIEIHCVVFDKAGNSNHGYTTTKVSNNPPRITSVMLGTDLNADGNYELGTEGSEFKTYYVSTNVNGSGNKTVGTERWDLEAKIDDTNYWTAKSGLVVIPEFVGGTGTIYYKYSKSTGENAEGLTSAATGTLTGTPTIKELSASDKHIRNGENQATLNAASGNTTGAIILATGTADSLTTISKTTGEISSTYTHPNIYSFSFWDSTEGCTPGVDSQWSVLNAKFKQDLVDDTPPTGTITPFYWKSLTENSVYTSKAVEDISSVADLEGHIELEGDLPADTFDEANGEFDRDPKVSGKIKVEGNAFDETRISSITVLFADKTVGATYNSIAKTWTFTGNEENIYKLTITDPDGPNQQGHAVTWELLADTSAVTTGKAAATDRIITVTVEDAADGTHNSSTPGTTQTGETKTGYYKVDIVPYITGIKTALSDLKKNNPSVYARTALGHYSVAATEKITINGFNLTGGTVNFAGGATASYDASGVSLTSLTSAKSGSMSIVVNEVESLNNSNNDDGHGSYDKTVNLTTNPTGDKTIFTNYYNRQPNGDNNNRLTDDVVVDIWEIDSNAAVPFNNKGKIAQAIMKINPQTNQLGFAFASGNGYFSMAGKTLEAKSGASNWTYNNKNSAFINAFESLKDYSYTFWCAELMEFSSVSFTYDEFGHSYGTAAGGNVNAGTSTAVDFFDFFTDRWGKGLGDVSGDDDHGHHKSSKSGYNSIRLEKTGVSLDNGNMIDTNRFHTPSIVTASHGTEQNGNTSVYLAYFDALTGEIRFRAGNTADKLNNTSFFKIGSISGNFYNLSNAGLGNNILSDGNRVNVYSSNNDTSYVAGPYIVQNYVQNSKLQLVDIDGTIITEDYSNHYLKLIPEQSKGNFGTFYDRWGTGSGKNSSIDSNNYDYIAVIAGISGRAACDYYSLGVIPGSTATEDLVFLIWYDENDRTLYYSYFENMTSANLKKNKTANGWTEKKRIFSEEKEYHAAGEYCQVAVDKEGGIHIATLDPSNSDLVYAYLSSTKKGKPSQTSDFQSCVVDSNGIVGDSLTIDVAFNKSSSNGGKPIPTIGYYSSSTKKPKIAYLVKTETYNPEGSIDDLFTGNWECSVVPAAQNLDFSDKNRISIGMFKENGIVKSNPHTEGSSYDNYLVGPDTVFYGAHNGIKYGNGTNNSVLGYVVKMSSSLMHIETAQMR